MFYKSISVCFALRGSVFEINAKINIFEFFSKKKLFLYFFELSPFFTKGIFVRFALRGSVSEINAKINIFNFFEKKVIFRFF